MDSNSSTFTSRTAPATPLRSARQVSMLNIPQSASRIDEIHLPPNELTAIHNDILAGNSSKRRRRSLTATPRSTRRLSTGTPGRRANSRASRSPVSRLHSPTASKRRRSSIIVESSSGTIFNQGYAGPITMDYLRFLCKITIEEKQRGPLPVKRDEPKSADLGPDTSIDSVPVKKDESAGVTAASPAKPVVPHGKDETPAQEYKDNDRSLLLPTNTDELFRSPNSSTEAGVNENPFLEPEKPLGSQKKYSYLERILAAQAEKNKVDPRASQPAENVELAADDIQSEYSPILDDIQSQNSPISVDELPAPISDYEPTKDLDSDNRTNGKENVQEVLPQDRGEAMTNGHEESRVMNDSFVDDAMDMPLDGDLVQDEYILEDNSRRNSLFDTLDVDTNPVEPTSPTPRVSPMKTKKRQASTANESLIPQQMIKAMVYTLNPVSQGPDRAIKRIKMDTEVLEAIQRQSDFFLDQLMSDLEAYAEHRGASSISIEDVMLYMNRLKYPNKDGVRINTADHFSALARTFLPLESLIQLENGLKEAYRPVGESSKPKPKRHKYYDESVIEDDESDSEDYSNSSSSDNDDDFRP